MTHSYSVRAVNTATASANKIHDDDVARKLGFSGGLVPGVDVYAYMTHVPAEVWGLDWLGSGTMRARFSSPVYDGETVSVAGEPASGGRVLELTLRNEQGLVCASGEAALVDADAHREPDEVMPLAPLPDDPPPASPEAFALVDVLGTFEIGFHADRAGEYLGAVNETLPLYTEAGVAHPGWMLRHANTLLGANVRLGPWIHVGSDVRFLGLVTDGDRVSVRGRVLGTSERKGHRFVDLDVMWVTDRPVMTAKHTAIYQPRGA